MNGRGRFTIALILALAAHALPFALPDGPDVPLSGPPLPRDVGINLATDMSGARPGGSAHPVRRGEPAADAPPDGAAEAAPESAMAAPAAVAAHVRPQAAPTDTVDVAALPVAVVPVDAVPLAAVARPAAVQPAVVPDAVPADASASAPATVEARPEPVQAVVETAAAPRVAPLPPPRPARLHPVVRPAAIESVQAVTAPAAQRSGVADPVTDTTAAEVTPAAGPPVRSRAGETSTEGHGGATAASVGGAPPDYLGTLRAWLERHKDYPRMAQRRRIEGRVMLRFAIDRQGKVLDWAIARSSGHPVLDAAAGDMIRRATPLPPMPEGLAMARLDVVVPVDFGLR